MKKILAVVFAVLCVSCCTMSALAEPSDVVSDAVVSDTVTSDDVTSEGTVSDDVVSNVASVPVSSDTSSDEVSSEIPEQIESSNDVNSPDIIVNYSAGHTDLGSEVVGIVIWIVCGVLLLACLILFIFKFIQYRNSK